MSNIVTVVGEEWIASERVLAERIGANKIVRRIERTEERHVRLSCGHVLRWPVFSSGGKDRKRLTCWECATAPIGEVS